MAKSIFELLDDLKTETSVPKLVDKKGNTIRENLGMVKHSLPRQALPTAEEFESEELLFIWAQKAGVLHACLQAGIRERIIELRAIFKTVKKDDIWSPEYGQENVNKAEWKPVRRPQKKKSDEEIATDFLKGLSPEERKKLLANII